MGNAYRQCEMPGCRNLGVKTKKSGRMKYCAGCYRQRSGKKRHANKSRIRSTEHQRNKARRRRERAIAYLGGKCMNPDCPISSSFQIPVCAFDFHHRNPLEKTANLSKLIATGSWARIEAELDKCDLLCCLCHRIHHGYREPIKKSIVLRRMAQPGLFDSPQDLRLPSAPPRTAQSSPLAKEGAYPG